MASKIRDPFFDVVKALAMILVVFGRVIPLSSKAMLPVWFDNFRIGLNMPIFFLIAGYFAWPTIEQSDWKKLAIALRSYFMPALIFSLAFLQFNIVWGVFVDPWFITILGASYVISFVSYRVFKNTASMLIAITLLLIVILFRPSFISGQATFSSLINMLPLFLIGIVLRKYCLRLWEWKKFGLACILTFIAFISLEGDVNTNGMSFYVVDSTWRQFMNVRGG